MARIDQPTVLGVLPKARLRQIAAHHGIALGSRLRKDEMMEILSASPRVPLRQILGELKRDELKAICRAAGIDDSGREKVAIVRRIVSHGLAGGVSSKRGLEPRRDLDTITRSELVDDVTAATGLYRPQAEVVVRAMFTALAEGLAEGSRIEIRGFGSFGVRQRRARTGRNPGTGAKVDIPAKRVPFFKPGKVLKELLNSPADDDPTRR